MANADSSAEEEKELKYEKYIAEGQDPVIARALVDYGDKAVKDAMNIANLLNMSWNPEFTAHIASLSDADKKEIAIAAKNGWLSVICDSGGGVAMEFKNIGGLEAAVKSGLLTSNGEDAVFIKILSSLLPKDKYKEMAEEMFASNLADIDKIYNSV